MTRDPVQIMALVATALEACKVPYMVGGSLASSRYGLPRTTQDVDMVADLREEHVNPLVTALQEEFYIDSNLIEEALQRVSSFNIIHLQSAHKVDIFILPSSEWAQQQMSRRRRETLGAGRKQNAFYFCSPEDIILNKLDWYRQGGAISERQWNDVLGVLKVQAAELEYDYLHHWAAELGLTDLLELALRQANVR
jgi:hypothetical protein